MTKIMYLTSDQEELRLAMDYAKKNGISLYPKTIPAPEEEYVRMCAAIAKDRDVDVIIAKGRVLAFLRELKCQIPTIPASFYGEVTIGALWEVRQKWDMEEKEKREGKIPKVALLSHLPLNIDEALYSSIFRMNVKNVIVPSLDANKSELFILELKSKGYDYVVCGKNFQEVVDRVDIKAHYITRPSLPQSIQRDLNIAKMVAQAISDYKRSFGEMQTVINYAFEAVITIDQNGGISVCNQVAAKAFQCEIPDVVGKKIWDVIPALPREIPEQVLKNDEKYYGQVLEYGTQAFVMNVTPLKKKEEVIGAVFHFTEFQDIEKLEATVKREYYSKGYNARYTFRDIVGVSEEMEESRRLAEQFAKYNSNVLIVGETGTGKEIFAQSIHNASLRKEEPFVAVNCGAIPVNLLESELFGYVDGAFTGASKKGKKGLVEIADHGTLFLDEISEMDLAGQVQLLRVLEERVIRRVGDDKEIPVDIRVIAASNKNLLDLIEQGKFREDLYYRLNVLTLYVPPLRERGGDILLLTRKFVDEFGKNLKKNVRILEEAEKRICQYEWKGNVRQLKNFCERLVIVGDQPELGEAFVERQLSDVYMLKLSRRQSLPAPEPVKAEPKKPQGILPLNEKEEIIRALNQTKGNRLRAAELLGISKTSLWRKMKNYGITEQYDA